jgi:hypothetical protein
MATPTSLPAAFTIGQVLTAEQMNDLRGAFRVLQIVQGSTSTAASNSTSTYVDTNLTATITPQSNTSKILVLVSQNNLHKSAANANNRMSIRLLRGATQLTIFANNILFTGTTLEQYQGSACVYYLDTPATTSATTYKTQFRSGDNSAAVSVQYENSGSSTIVLLEISA